MIRTERIAYKGNPQVRTVTPIKGKMMNCIMLIHLSVNIIFWMHTAGTAHGNIESPPWIALSGCFNYSINNATINIQNNEPTQCFEKCPSSQSVALKNMSCICNPLYTSNGIRLNRFCNLSCPGKSEVYCGREGGDDQLMSVYTRDTSLPDSINGSTSYGYGYVVISGGNKIIHASDNTSLKYGYICYNDFESPGSNRCKPEKLTLMTWGGANNQCNGISFRLITASDVSTCVAAGSAFDGTYWIGIYREKPRLTTLTTTTSTSTTAKSTSTTATSTSFTSLKLAIGSITTTGLRPSHNSDNPVIEQTSKASSSVGIKAVAVAVPVVAFLVVLGSILFCKKRKLLCFKERQQSGKVDDSNNASPQEIPELATMALSSFPPVSTRAPFQSQRQNGRPTTASEREIQDGHRDQTVLNTDMSYTNMGGETQYRFGGRSVGLELAHNGMEDTMQSNMKVGEKHKKKRGRKSSKKDKHSSSVDKECEDIKANTEDNHEHLYSHTNDNLNVVNEGTEHSNGEGQDNETKKKTQRAKEYSYSDETGSGIFSEHHSKRRVATISQVNDMGNLPEEPNYRVKHNQGCDGLFDAPAAAPVIDEHTHLNFERLRKKHKKSRMKDEKCGNEDRPDQAGPDSNEVLKEPTDNNNATRKEKKKKRKKSRERSKEKVQNGYDEVEVVTTARSVPEEQTDLQNEESSKKHKKKRKKKHKKSDEMNAAKQEGLDLENDENDQKFNIRL